MQIFLSDQSRFKPVPGLRLPIYLSDFGDHVLVYAPGLACVMNRRDKKIFMDHTGDFIRAEALNEPGSSELLTNIRSAAMRIVAGAQRAVQERAQVSRRPYTPECLTVYVNNQCNLKCRYCYSLPGDRPDGGVSTSGVREAAKLVARECAARNLPFTLVFHGGGEPALHPRQVDRLLDIASEEAAKFGLQTRTYIATNGAVPETTAHWLARRFDLVGISCDGPPEIQDYHRPGRTGRAMSRYVERTMEILTRKKRPFHVRVTVSARTLDLQARIVSYLTRNFGPEEIRIEPLYANSSCEPSFKGADAAAFAAGFLDAREKGRAVGVGVTTSITRPSDVYGPYCNVLRQVFNLVPGDVGTACFLESRPENIATRGLMTASFDPAANRFRINNDLIRSLMIRCADRPARCNTCLCSFQCTYGCPDHCILDVSSQTADFSETGGAFRCRVNKMLLEAFIRGAARDAWVRSGARAYREVWDPHRMLTVLVCGRETESRVEF